ncbi:MAG TPA: hypothetical protein GXX58_04235 [Gelria sp.]|nr:hypothetical protein [Gelria sp.]
MNFSGETENKPISSEAERKKFKNWSVAIMIIYGFIIVLFSNLSVLNYVCFAYSNRHNSTGLYGITCWLWFYPLCR